MRAADAAGGADPGLVLHSPWTILSWVLGTFVWLVFTVELALTLHYAQDRRAALRAHWADGVVVFAIFPLWGLFFAALGPGGSAAGASRACG